MKKNFLLAKLDFDTYVKTNLTGKTNVTSLDSITAIESQTMELLKDSDNKVITLPKEHDKNEQDNLSSQSNKTGGSVQDILESIHEKRDNDSLSSILSGIDNVSQKSDNHILTNSPSSSFLSSSESSSSSSSNNTTNSTDEDSIATNMKKLGNKQNKKNQKSKNKHPRKERVQN